MNVSLASTEKEIKEIKIDGCDATQNNGIFDITKQTDEIHVGSEHFLYD